MNSQRLLDTFLDMVRTDSPSRHEAAMAAFCQRVFEAEGFSVRFDDAGAQTGSEIGNLIADLPGTDGPAHDGVDGGHVVLSAHMDCVVPCCGVQPVVEDGVVKSAGDTVLGADDKSGIAAIMEAVRCVREEGKPHPRITVILTVCEELSCLGSKAFAKGEFSGNVPCFVLDADGHPGTIILGAPYHYTFKGTFEGKTSHAGVAPERGINAIAMAADAVSRMELGRLGEHSTANVGMVSGGREVNIIPDVCVIDGECRSLHENRVEAIKAQLTESMQAAADAFGGSVKIDWRVDYPGILHSEDDPIIQNLVRVAKQCQLDVNFKISGGGSDANLFGDAGLVPVALGVGMTNFHATNEFISVKDLENMALFTQSIIDSYAV